MVVVGKNNRDTEIEVAEMRCVLSFRTCGTFGLYLETLVGSGGADGGGGRSCYWWPITITYKLTPAQQGGRELGQEAIKRIQ